MNTVTCLIKDKIYIPNSKNISKLIESCNLPLDAQLKRIKKDNLTKNNARRKSKGKR